MVSGRQDGRWGAMRERAGGPFGLAAVALLPARACVGARKGEWAHKRCERASCDIILRKSQGQQSRLQLVKPGQSTIKQGEARPCPGFGVALSGNLRSTGRR